MKYHLLVLIVFLNFELSTAQSNNTNIFLERSFWKTNPSIQTIKQKIAEGNDIAALNKNAFDGVVYALLEKVDNETIKYLLSQKGNEVNKITHDGRTYLFWAAYKGNLEIMKYVISKGAKTDIIDSHGYSVLNFAASTGQLNIDIYKYCFEINSDITKEKNHNDANALLLIAPYVTDYKIIDYFISKGAALQDKDKDGNGIFEYATKGGNILFLRTLLEKRISVGKNAMIFASQGLRRKKNTLEMYQFLESVGALSNVIDAKGRNPLHYIAYTNKDISIFKYFIERGVAVNLQDNIGNSPFINAARNNDSTSVKFLYKYIKDINVKNKDGLSALAMAVNKNSSNVIKFLLENGSDIHTVDEKGNTLSYYLLNNFSVTKTTIFEDKLKLLQENGLVIQKPQNSRNTLLHLAVKRNNLALLERLFPFKIDVNAKNSEGFSALQIAAMKGENVKIMKYLLSIGADTTVKTSFDETIYDLASENELLKN